MILQTSKDIVDSANIFSPQLYKLKMYQQQFPKEK